MPEDATEVFEPAEGTADEAELELEDVTAEELVAREPGDELAIAVIVVARTEPTVVFAPAGVSITSGLVATKTKATFWARCMLPSDPFDDVIREGSAARTVILLVKTRSALDVEFMWLLSASVTLGSDAFCGAAR